MQVSPWPATPDHLAEQASRFHRLLSALLKRYQLRDRNEICCHGVSVAQCYTMEALGELGAATMSELAGRLCVTVSTMTRVVDGLVAKGLVSRTSDPADRRVVSVELATQGAELLAIITAEVLEREKALLSLLTEGQREQVITALEHLAEAMRSCCAPAASSGKVECNVD